MWIKKLILGFFLFSTFGCSSGCTQTSNQPSATDSAVPDSSSPVVIDWDDCSGNIGDHGCDFTFKDQNNNDWRLYDHLGSVIVLDFSAGWCGYCRISAAEVQAIQDLYGDQDFIWVSILIEDSMGNPADLADVQDWASAYGITTSPTLVGDRSIIDITAEDGYPVTSWPTFVILDRELIIQHGLNGWSKELIMSWLLEVLEE